MTVADAMDESIIPIDSLDDPRIADYRLLKDRELAECGGKFIAEGELVSRRPLARNPGTGSRQLRPVRFSERVGRAGRLGATIGREYDIISPEFLKRNEPCRV